MTVTLLSCCGSRTCGVHTDSIAAAVLILPALCFYIEFAFHKYNTMKALLTSEWILSTETLEGFKSETDTEGGNNWEDSDTK